MLSPVFSSALGLYQALQHAAAHAPEDAIVHGLPDWRPADDGEEPEVYLLHTANGWHQPKIPAQTGVIAMHGPQRHGVGKVTFAFTPSPGVRSSFSVVGIRPRLLEMAEQVRKHWAMYGGGPKPAIDKPTKRAVTWPASIIKVWLAQIEDKDHAGAMLTGERIGAQYYPGNKDSIIVMVAPVQVDGLPDGMCSARRGDGRWIVADMRTGRAIEARGYGSRKAAEESALAVWQGMDDDRRENALHRIAGHETADTAAARAAWCAARGIEDPGAADDGPAVATAPDDGQPADAAADALPDAAAVSAQGADDVAAPDAPTVQAPDAAALADDVAAPDAPCTPCGGIFGAASPVAEFLESAPSADQPAPGSDAPESVVHRAPSVYGGWDVLHDAPEGCTFVSRYSGQRCNGIAEVSARILAAKLAKDNPGQQFTVAPMRGSGGKFEVRRWQLTVATPHAHTIAPSAPPAPVAAVQAASEPMPSVAPDFPGLGTVADYIAAYADKPGAVETLRALAADDDAYALSYGAPPDKARYSAARASLYRAAAAAIAAPPSGGSLYTPPAEAGIPPPAQTAQADKPGGLPQSGAVLVPWPKPRRAARSTSGPRLGTRWRGVAPPPVESWRIPPAEAGPGCTPWRAKDTGRWRGSCSFANVSMHRAWRGILAPICGPPALPSLQAWHHQRQQERHHGQL